MPDTMNTKTAQLWEVCRNFIEEQQISCAEAVCQSDRVILNAYEFIEKICDIVGYYQYPEMDEDEI